MRRFPKPGRAALSWLVILAVLVAACDGDDDAKTADEPDFTIHFDTVQPEDTVAEDTPEEVAVDTEPPQVCEPETRECDGKDLLTCKEDGSGYASEHCEYGCDPVTRTCMDKLCDVGSQKCANSHQLLVCADDEMSFHTLDCPGDTICQTTDQVSQCVNPPACTAGDTVCDETGLFLKTCKVDGNGYDWDKCPYGCIEGACQEKVCEDKATRCDPEDATQLQTCNDLQTGWDDLMICDDGCVPVSATEAKCEDHPCDVGETRCNAYSVEVCKSDQSGFQFQEGCPNGCFVTGPGQAMCGLCEKDATACDGETPQVCNDPTAGWVDLEACSSDVTCAGGSCVPWLVLTDEESSYATKMKLIQAVVDCYKSHEGDSDSAMCYSLDTLAYSEKISSTDLITEWFCAYLFYEWEFTETGDLEIAEDLFSCESEAGLKVQFPTEIWPDEQSVICIWFDAEWVDEVYIEFCDEF